MDLVETHFPEPTDEQIERYIRAGAAYAIERGLTGAHDMGIEPEGAAVYRRMAEAGELPLRVNAYLSEVPERAPETADTESWFHINGVKLYADGALGSRGAALRDEYADAPGERGNWVTSPEDLRAQVAAGYALGLQMAIHAIGDAAIDASLDAYAALGRDIRGRRMRVEHVQVIAREDVQRFVELGVLASMQPSHATSDMPWAEERVGLERVEGAYAWRTLLDAGVIIVGGSDFPVEEVGPLLQFYAAVTRQDVDGNPAGGWYPAQRMTLEEALYAYTFAPAYAVHDEQHRGRIEVGRWADLTVVDGDLVADRTLLERTVDFTIVGGKVVFEREAEVAGR
jgi:hypothetical protein